ncbi:MAG: endonuclease/exonuclease/phosphatase family protein, partial [Candidatus Thiodiazotropha sp.]
MQGLKKYDNNNSFKNYCKSFDLIALYETWQENENDFQDFMDGYTNFDSMRTKKRSAVRGSGGVTVFVKEWLMQTSGVKRIFDKTRECVTLLFKAGVFCRKTDLIIIFTYIPPENSPVYVNESNGIVLLSEHIDEILLQYPNAELLLAGDLNSRIGDLQDYIPFDDLYFIFGDTDYPTDSFDIGRKSKDETYNRFGTSLIDLCCTYNIHTLNGRLFEDANGEITCVANNGRSVVDYMLASTSLFESFTYFRVGSEDFSDHFPLQCKLSLTYQRDRNFNDRSRSNVDKNAWNKYKWREDSKNEFLENFSKLFQNFKNQFLSRTGAVLPLLPQFMNIIKQAGKCMKVKIKKAQKSNEQPPWWDNDCQIAKTYKYTQLKSFRRTNSHVDLSNYKAAKLHFKSVYRSKRWQYEKRKRTELIKSSQNPREYWQNIKRNCNKRTDGETQVSSDDWFMYFKNLLNMTPQENNNGAVLQNIRQEHDSNELDSQITDSEIISSTKFIHSNRSPGPDGICIEMIKAILTDVLPFLNILFNEIYDLGVFPRDWYENIICPIHKSGSMTNPENFRGISLINSIS